MPHDHIMGMPQNIKPDLALLDPAFFCPSLISKLNDPAIKKPDSFRNQASYYAHSEGFEPSTLGAEIRYSIQLNYECGYFDDLQICLPF